MCEWMAANAAFRLLSGVKITDMKSLTQAIQALHDTYKVPHVVITSVKLSGANGTSNSKDSDNLSIMGSTMTSSGKARPFKIAFPAIDCYFCGTGDMFGALMVVRMREAVSNVEGLAQKASWLSADDVATLDLPLAKAAEKVLASMHEMLSKTCEGMKRVVERTQRGMTEEEKADEKKQQLLRSKGAELQLVRNLECLRSPVAEFRAEVLS